MITDDMLFYPDLFKAPIIDMIYDNIDERLIEKLTTGLAVATGKIYKPKSVDNQQGSLACIILQNEIVTFKKHKSFSLPCKAGSVIILGPLFRKKWEYTLPELSIKLYEENYLPSIYLDIKKRLKYMKKIQKTIKKTDCPQKNMDLQLLGTGSYGNVFKTGNYSEVFALKMTKLKPEAVKSPYNFSLSSWHEIYLLENIIKKLIEKGICPNLPLMYDKFMCNSCDLKFDDKIHKLPCSVISLELADGNLKNYLQTENTTIEELYSCLFQIMAALHTIQYYAQILNFDIKKENILFYNVIPGGYWKYTIKNRDYYVPNYGKLFVLNDFGLSRTMSPDYPLYKTLEEDRFRLGSRYAIIKDGVFHPFNSKKGVEIRWVDHNGEVNFSKGSEFKLQRGTKNLVNDIPKELKSYYRNNSIDFFKHSEIIPPFEFYNDTQDVIRMFAGGKRTTQKGYHRAPKSVPKKFIKKLSEYIGEGESMKDGVFNINPNQVLASYFIESFFGDYRVRPEGAKIIGSYVISI
jgi:serine/threonine protein kinase